MDFLSFKKHAFSKLTEYAETKRQSYEKSICENFGRLRNLVEAADLDKIAKLNNFNLKELKKLKKVSYADLKFPYFIHDNNYYIGTDDKGVIIDIGDYNSSLLKQGDIL